MQSLRRADRTAEGPDRLAGLTALGDALGTLEEVLACADQPLDRLAVDDLIRDELVATFSPTVLTLWQVADDGTTWRPRLAEGRPTPPRTPTAALPAHVIATITGDRPQVFAELAPTPHPRTAAALCATLRTPDGRLVGVVTVEHPAPGRYTAREAEVLGDLAAGHALMIDNARRLARLRLESDLSARVQLLRETQDRLGQWLSYVALELEALMRERTSERLLELYRDVNAALEESRAALRDSANGVRTGRPFAVAARELLERVEEQTSIETTFEASLAAGPLPVAAEQRAFAILREAVHNSQQHADASAIDVRWCLDEAGGLLEIADDGIGFDLGTSVRDRARGLIQMYDHAEAICGDLTVQSSRGQGTTVVVRTGRDPATPKGDETC